MFWKEVSRASDGAHCSFSSLDSWLCAVRKCVILQPLLVELLSWSSFVILLSQAAPTVSISAVPTKVPYLICPLCHSLQGEEVLFSLHRTPHLAWPLQGRNSPCCSQHQSAPPFLSLCSLQGPVRKIFVPYRWNRYGAYEGMQWSLLQEHEGGEQKRLLGEGVIIWHFVPKS